MGNYHNIIVDEMIERYGYNNEVKAEEVLAQVNSSQYRYEIENLYDDEKFSTTLHPFFEHISDDYDTAKSNYYSVIENNSTSQFAKTYMYEIMDVIFSLKEEDYNYKTFYSTIVQIENNIIKDSNLLNKEKVIILKGSSVARHTVDLWLNKHYEIEKSTLGEKRKRKWWTWLLIGGADVGAAWASGKISDAVTASKFIHDITAPVNKVISPTPDTEIK